MRNIVSIQFEIWIDRSPATSLMYIKNSNDLWMYIFGLFMNGDRPTKFWWSDMTASFLWKRKSFTVFQRLLEILSCSSSWLDPHEISRKFVHTLRATSHGPGNVQRVSTKVNSNFERFFKVHCRWKRHWLGKDVWNVLISYYRNFLGERNQISRCINMVRRWG